MATWDERNCQSFDTAARGFEPGFSRLRVPRSNRCANTPHQDQRSIHNLGKVVVLLVLPNVFVTLYFACSREKYFSWSATKERSARLKMTTTINRGGFTVSL